MGPAISLQLRPQTPAIWGFRASRANKEAIPGVAGVLFALAELAGVGPRRSPAHGVQGSRRSLEFAPKMWLCRLLSALSFPGLGFSMSGWEGVLVAKAMARPQTRGFGAPKLLSG